MCVCVSLSVCVVVNVGLMEWMEWMEWMHAGSGCLVSGGMDACLQSQSTNQSMNQSISRTTMAA